MGAIPQTYVRGLRSDLEPRMVRAEVSPGPAPGHVQRLCFTRSSPFCKSLHDSMGLRRPMSVPFFDPYFRIPRHPPLPEYPYLTPI